jgi:hypothetical protein
MKALNTAGTVAIAFALGSNLAMAQSHEPLGTGGHSRPAATQGSHVGSVAQQHASVSGAAGKNGSAKESDATSVWDFLSLRHHM